ncbi:hypothetical protein BZA77DRAFT_307040 [Pyronema omphalodes]|nr:hypothetical protein BZA77DRAFT_307040 [Pyronema omphalodes]
MATSTEIYTQLPLRVDRDTLEVSCPGGNQELQAFLAELNQMHKALSIEKRMDGVPPPPVPVNPARSGAIEKQRAAGNAAFTAGNYKEAVVKYSHGIIMALSRPPWEPAPLMKEEIQILYSNRAQAHLLCNNYPEALADASLSVDLKRQQNNKAHYRKARALKEMGRFREARDALVFGLEYGEDAAMRTLLTEVEKSLEAKGITF